MKRYVLLLASAALALGSNVALADCAEELARLQGGISKDGTHAPLEDAAAATPQQGAEASAGAEATGQPAKDGSGTPLGADPDVAASAEDAQAQSQGGQTAAAQAAGETGGGVAANADALARAQAALDAGDEAGCMSALEEAKAS
jgi:hypothetical protein